MLEKAILVAAEEVDFSAETMVDLYKVSGAYGISFFVFSDMPDVAVTVHGHWRVQPSGEEGTPHLPGPQQVELHPLNQQRQGLANTFHFSVLKCIYWIVWQRWEEGSKEVVCAVCE